MLNLIDPAFDRARTEKYSLAVVLRPDGFSLSVFDERTTLFLALSDQQFLPANATVLPGNESLCDRFNALFRQQELLRYPYKAIKLVYASPKVTLVPPGFLREETIEEYFRFNHPLSAAEKILVQQVPVGEMNALFALPACIDKLSEEWFRNAVAGCTASVLIQGLLRENAHILARQVFVNVWGSYFDIIVIQGRKLLYYNTFRKQAAEDLVYFIIYVLEQMGFVPADEEVTLMGDIVADSDEYRLLYQYIDRLHFASLHTLAEFSPVFAEVLVHKFYTLFTLPFCE